MESCGIDLAAVAHYGAFGHAGKGTVVFDGWAVEGLGRRDTVVTWFVDTVGILGHVV